MGLPILLAAPEGEASSVVEGDGAGVCVPPEDPDALAAAVRRLMLDAHLRKGLANASLAAAPGHSREHQARYTIGVLQMAADGLGAEVGRMTPSPPEPA